MAADPVELKAAGAQGNESKEKGAQTDVEALMRRLRAEQESLTSELANFRAELKNSKPRTDDEIDKEEAQKHLTKEQIAAIPGLHMIAKKRGCEVTEGPCAKTGHVDVLPKGSHVSIIKVLKETKDAPRVVRAQIYDPPGYITVWDHGQWNIKQDYRLMHELDGTGVDYHSLSPRSLHVQTRELQRTNRLRACEFSPLLWVMERTLVGIGL